MTTTDGRTLPWRVVGRAVRPYAFAVSLATSVSVWSVATDRAVGALLDGLPGAVIAAASAQDRHLRAQQTEEGVP